MRISYNSLKKIVDFPFSAEELGEKLNSLGFEVKNIELFEEDVILDLEITSNRGDCLSLMGIAREISALTEKSLHFSPYDGEIMEGESLFQVEIKDVKICPYYSACLIKNVKVGPSPLWLQKEILISGGKPINNVVDITNYVLWETGQPLHSFDFSSLSKEKVIVRRAREGEILVTLDDVERKLNKDMLVIADEEKAIALAGIIGGRDTQIQDYTRDILLESAYFNPVSIRKTSQRMDITTEASYRFERGVDPRGARKALKRAAYLFQKITGGKVVGGIAEAGKLPPQKKWVSFRPLRVNRIIGKKVSPSRIKKIFHNLQFEVEERKDKWVVGIPSFRKDIDREIDLIEEVVRFYGYNKIPVTLPSLGKGMLCEDFRERLREKIREVLRGLGFYEVIGVSLEEELTFKKANLSINEGIKLKNPMSIQQSILSTYLFPHLLRIALYNLNQGVEELRIFEFGNIFRKNGTSWEKTFLSNLVMEKNFDFFSLKGIGEVLLEELAIDKVDFSFCNYSYLSPRERAIIKKDNIILGVLGRLDEKVAESFELPSYAYLLEFDVSNLLSFCKLEKKVKPLPKFPFIRRDLSLLVKKGILTEEVRRLIFEEGEDLEKVEFFDLYQGRSIPSDYKSLACSLVFRAADRTLRDEEVNKIQEKIINSLKEKMGIYLRGESPEIRATL